jgi:hypothetical protein
VVAKENAVRGITLKHYKTWQSPIYAFFSTQFYRELGALGKGIGFVYLLALLAIAVAVAPVKQFASFQANMLNNGRDFVEQMPEVTIDNGKLRINQESPYYISDPQTGEYILAFDTSGQSQTPSDLKVNVLVTAGSVLIRSPQGDFENKLKDIQHFHASPQDLMHWLSLGSYLLPVFTYAGALPFAWVGHIIQALGFSLAGLLLAKTISVDIKYEGILRITCVALGNVILLDAFMQIFPLDIPGLGALEIAIPNWGLFKFFLALGYTLFGVGANLSPPSFESVSDSDTGPSGGQR